MQPRSYKSLPSKVFIFSIFLLVFVDVAGSNPVKPTPRTINVNFSLMKLVSTVKVQSKTTKFVQMNINGTVKGSNYCSLPTVTMEIYSVGLAGVKLIKGVASGRYLAMNKTGDIYTTANASAETLFVLAMNSLTYSTFASFKYRNRYVGMKNNGKITVTSKNDKHVSVEFLLVKKCKL